MAQAFDQEESGSGTGRRVSHYATPVEEEEFEFIQAIERFKAEHNQPFPSWTEVLGILKSLGYEKISS
ncbi:MAG: hypothetical protein H6807_07815 [Planctomycetes bacterium]|nr:hypothetical protein [Planctomycetota bacterium]